MRSTIEQSGDGTPSMYPFDGPCPPGCWPARVGQAKESVSRAGTPQIELVMHIDSPQGPSAHRFYVQAQGAMSWTFGNAVKALLHPAEVARFTAGEPVELVAAELVGLRCRVQVGVEKVKDRETGELTGETKPRVLSLLPIENGVSHAPPAKLAATTQAAAPAKEDNDDGFA